MLCGDPPYLGDGIITATPYWNRGKQLRDIEGKRGAPFGETVMQETIDALKENADA